jgi:hypothetical protein
VELPRRRRQHRDARGRSSTPPSHGVRSEREWILPYDGRWNDVDVAHARRIAAPRPTSVRSPSIRTIRWSCTPRSRMRRPTSPRR